MHTPALIFLLLSINCVSELIWFRVECCTFCKYPPKEKMFLNVGSFLKDDIRDLVLSRKTATYFQHLFQLEKVQSRISVYVSEVWNFGLGIVSVSETPANCEVCASKVNCKSTTTSMNVLFVQNTKLLHSVAARRARCNCQLCKMSYLSHKFIP